MKGGGKKQSWRSGKGKSLMVMSVVMVVVVGVRATVAPTAIALATAVVITDVQCTFVSQALGQVFHMHCISPKITRK